jgi:UDP-N-acetylmuramoyl-L-alanyl-D-glutamate--2,6-diaminopimelate ligase
MHFSILAHDCERHGPDVEIAGLSRDSRNVARGFLFAAIPGVKNDGGQFIAEALSKGAVAILAAPGTPVPEHTPVAYHPEPRKALALIASRFYPAQPATIAAVTGTSGKTSAVQFLRQIWQQLGHKSAAIGTLGIIGDGIERYGSLTTPDAISLHDDMQMLANEKQITHAAIEASSHGLDQYRLDGLKISYAAFTNLSRDHLDYHKDMADYFRAKSRLFSEVLQPNGVAVLNADVLEYAKLKDVCKARGIRTISFGTRKEADLCLSTGMEDASGQKLQLVFEGKSYDVHINLAGAFQGLNVLCAAALAHASGESMDKIISVLPKLQGVRGRMELIGTYNNARVYVDYAHKPDALENVLNTLRPSTRGKLVVVFGCGGGRDKGKRPIMGEIAARLADTVIVTDDNPRMEEPAAIRAEILAAAKGAKEIADRAEAIKSAVSNLQPNDTLVIAGKGHEPGQLVGTETLPFDDAEQARQAMKAKAA